MLDNVGKLKSKRNPNSKPYERPKSILRRVTDSVTGLLPQPSWLSSWLQRPPQDGVVVDDDIEENVEMPTPSTSMASDRIEASPGGSQNQTGSFIFRKPPRILKEPSNGRTTLHHFPLPVIPEPSVISGPSLREIPLQTNGDDDSHSESTSGCSSLVPHPEHRRRENHDLDVPIAVEPLSINQSSLRRLGESLSNSLAADLKSHRGRKTLSLHTFSQDSSQLSPTDNVVFNKESGGASVSSMFDRGDVSSLNHSASNRDLSQSQSCNGSKRPRFNITSFGPSAAEARKSLLHESVVDSPFYAGRTTYGGASAYRRATLQPSATAFPYVRKRVYARPASISSVPPIPLNGSIPVSSTSNVVLSSSAQRILHALEAMSTPVRDAKRIPTSNTSRFTSIHDDESSFIGYGLSRRRPNLGPPASKLSIGTPTQIVLRQPVAKPPSEAMVSSTPIHSQGGGKVRSRVSAPARGPAPKALEEEEEQDALLSVAMPLGLSSLPSFSLLPPPPNASKSQEIPSKQLSPKQSFAPNFSGQTVISTTTSSPVTTRPTFTFSAPLVTVISSSASSTISPTSQSFNFSSPLTVMRDTQKEQERSSTVTGKGFEIIASKSIPIASGESLSLCEPSRSDDGPKKPLQTMEPLSLIGFGDKFKPPPGSWTCLVCCVSNPKDKIRCVSCDSACPTTSATTTFPSPTPISTPSKGFGDKFKMSSGQWECTICMVRNPQKNDQCSSCEGLRPGSKLPSTPVAVSSFKFGMPSNKDAATGSKSTFGMSGSIPSGDVNKKLKPGIATSSVSLESSAIKPEIQCGDSVQPSVEDKKANGGFNFGATNNQTSKLEEPTGFKFGVTVEQPSFGAAVDQSSKLGGTAGFKFGASLGNNNNTKLEGFQFDASIEKIETVKENNRTYEFASTDKKEIKKSSKGTQIELTSPAQPAPLLFSALGEKSKPDEHKSQFSSESTSGLPFSFKVTPSSLGTEATSVDSLKTESIFSFGKVLAGQKSGDHPSTLLETGSVVDSIGKRPQAAVSNTGLPPVLAPAATAGSGTLCDKSKSTSTLTNVLPATTEAAPFSFSSLTAATRSSIGQAPVITTAALVQAINITSGTFSFGVSTTTTTTPSQSLFKPASTAAVAPFTFNSAPSGLFAASTSTSTLSSAPLAFGVPSTTSAAPKASSSTFSFGSTSTTTAAPMASSGTFSFGSTSTTTAAPTASSSTFSFGPTSTTKVVSTASSGTFSFGSSSTLAPTTTSSSAAISTPGKFSFGLPSTTVSTSSSSVPLFSFGSQFAPPPAYPGFGISSAGNPPSTSTSSSIFSFGATGAAVTTPVNTPSSETPKPSLFSFGGAPVQQPATSTNAAPAFGSFGATPAKTSETPFSFGSAGLSSSSGLSATSAFGEISKSTGATFGAPSATPFGSTPTAGFGAPTMTSSASPFTFGAPSASGFSQPPTFNATPNFSFSGVAAPAAASSMSPAGVFQFGNAPAANTGFGFNPNSSFASTPSGQPGGFSSEPFGLNPFDITGGGGGSGARNVSDGRKIRKALRRQR